MRWPRCASRAVALICAVVACARSGAASRDPITSYPPEWPHRSPWKLSREMLLPDAERIVLLVDVPRGSSPNREALDHLAALASKYGERPATWTRLGEPGAPDVRRIDPPVSQRPVN